MQLGTGVFAGMGGTVMTGVESVGAKATIGAGAVVIRDVPAGATVVGNPARVLKRDAVAGDKVEPAEA